MAHVYVRSGAGGTGTGASWANAYTTLAAAFAAKAAGDNFWVSEDHAESTASPVLQSPATAALPCTAICVNHAGSVPPVSADFRTTATITASSGFMNICNGSEFIYYYGITFIVPAAAIYMGLSATTLSGYFKSCTFKNTSAVNSTVIMGAGATDVNVVFDNTGFNVAGPDTILQILSGHLLWKNTATPVTGTFPIYAIYSNPGSAVLDGVDLSAAGFSGNYLALFHAGSGGSIMAKNCKTHASLVKILSGPGASGAAFYYINTDSSGTNYRDEKTTYQGSQVPETTIVRTGGATDGTTPIATKIVTTANSNWLFPFESMQFPIWNDTTGANVTVTVFGVWGGGAVPNNDDIWIEVSYLGASTSPIATINTANTKADYMATNAAQTSDGSTWGGSTTKFKMSVTLSTPQPAMKGDIYVTVKAAKASSTFYIDPTPVLT